MSKPEQAMERIAELAGGKKVVLHLGCGAYKVEKLHGRYRTPDWFELRYDINKAVEPHILGDMRDLSMIPDGTVDAIWNSHSIEHLFAHEIVPALKEWRRVLKPGGGILLTLPDLQSVCAPVAQGKLEDALYQSPAGPIMALDVIYGYGADIANGNVYMAHKTGFTAETLGKKLVLAGFTEVTVLAKGFDLWAEGKSPLPGVAPSTDIRITRDTQPPVTVPATAPAPAKHPGALWKGKRTDELDVPPADLD